MTHPAEVAIDEVIAEYLASTERLIALGPRRALPVAPPAPSDEAFGGRER